MSLNRRAFLRSSACASLVGALPIFASATEQNIKYGGSAWLGHYPAYLAMSEGYFKDVGITQDWQSFGTSSARMSAVMSGGIDIACTGIVSALALMSRGAKQFSIIGIHESFGRVEGIVGRQGIRSIADLKGKKLGVTFASSAHVLVLDVLTHAGLGPKDVSILNVPAPELPAAFQAGQIDAVAAWTPQFDSILRQPGVTLLADDTQFSLFQSHKVTPGPDVLIVRKAFAEKNKGAVQGYLKGFFRACDQLREKPESAVRSLTKLTNLSNDEQLAVIKGVDWYSHAQQKALLSGSYVDGLQKLAELLVTHKQIDKAPNVKDWVDPSFI